MRTNIGHYFKHLTCTLFVVLGLLGIFAPASQAATGAFTISAATYAVNEGAGNVKITINRVGGSTGSASVSFRTGSVVAKSGTDYVGIPLVTQTFASGVTQKVISIGIIDDKGIESNESFMVLLSAPTTGTTLGSITSSTITIQDNDTIVADTTSPTVSLTSPASATNFTSAQTVTIAASAADNVGVSKVELYDGATLKATDTTAPYSFAWAITSANNGSHSFTAKAYDAAGNSKISVATAVTVNIPVPDLTVPTISLTSPVNNTTFTSAQSVTIAAAGTDNVGLSKVEFYDGATLKATDTTAPYSVSWTITSSNNGSHSLTAKAYDAAGNSKISSAVVVTINIAQPVVSGPLKVFPGAEGFGTATRAGRGGQVIKVTNLNDSGAGSLRAAVATAGPRIIVFEVGGHIKLTSDLAITQPFVTIAGQSAPFPGIQISGGRITIQSHDVLLQHVRSRYGDYSGASVSHSLRVISGSYNVVVDHCTFMWADDEVASIWTNDQPIHSVTLSNCIIAESFGSGYGTIVGAKYAPSPGPNWVDKISLIKNLYAHNNERSPSLSRDVNAVVINNLSYNSKWEFIVLGLNNGPTTASIIGNHFITGFSNGTGAAIAVAPTGVGSKIYQTDNRVTGVYSRNVFSDGTGNSVVSQPPIADDTTILTGSAVKNYVLKNVGARPAYRDSAEIRVINDVLNATGFKKTSIAAAGGWPTDYNKTTTRSFSAFIPNNPNGDDNGNGYTNIEEVLYNMAAEVEGRL